MEPKTSAYARGRAQLKSAFVGAAFLSALVNILMLTGPIFMLQVYDRVLSSGSVPTLVGLFAIVVFAYLFLGLYDLLRTRIMSRAAHRLDETVGRDAFEEWVRAGADPTAQKARPLGDLAVIRGFLASPGMLGIFDLPWVPFYLAIVFFLHPWLGYLALAGAAVVTVLALVNQAVTREPIAEAMGLDAQEAFFLEQAHRNAESVTSMGMLANMREHWRRMHGTGLATAQRGGERGEAFTASSKAFRLLLQSSLLGLGGYLALQGQISAGVIVAASIIAGRALAPIDQVIGQWRNVVRARTAARRLQGVLEAERVEAPDMDLPEPKGVISVNDVVKYAPNSLGQRDRKPVLEGISFRLEPGDALGVIGPSASGKTTLARLLVGAWEADGGDVRLDGAKLSHWPRRTLGRHVGYLPQTLELMAGTVRDNIARFDPEASDEAVVAAAQLADVHDMILQLPEGYATRMSFGTGPLSGGQVQRIGLARALYGMPKFVVLDEPNSNLDAEGDHALSRAIVALREAGSTVVVMAHRPSAIAAVNKLVVLNDGRIADIGPKEEVLRRATRAAPEPQRTDATPPAAANEGGELERTA